MKLIIMMICILQVFFVTYSYSQKINETKSKEAIEAEDSTKSIKIDVKNENVKNFKKYSVKSKGIKIAEIDQDGDLINIGKRYAIVVGINDYNDIAISDLSKAQNDAKAVGKLLREIGQFDQVFIMTDDIDSRKDSEYLYPTKLKIEEKIESVLRFANPEDMIVFFFSGHGISDLEENGYLVTVDTVADKKFETSLKVDWIVKKFQEKKIKKTLLVLDACRDKLYTSKNAERDSIKEKIYSEAEVAATFYSTKSGYYSYEDDESDYGVFTKHLIYGMEGNADDNKDGVVSFGELEQYVNKGVHDWSIKKNKRQKPFTKIYGEKTGDLAITIASNPTKSLADKKLNINISSNLNLKQGNTNIPPIGWYDFGYKIVNSNMQVPFMIENRGTRDLHLTGAPFINIVSGWGNPSAFIVKQPSSSIIPANGNLSFSISCSTNLSGVVIASVRIETNDNQTPNFLFYVKCRPRFTENINGTDLSEITKGIGKDKVGNLYICGDTNGNLNGKKNSGSDDIFLLKYDSFGFVKWTEVFGTVETDNCSGVATDSSGYIYVTGSTLGELDGNSNNGSFDFFLAKYNPSGVRQWTRQIGSSGVDISKGIAIDSNDNIYIAGFTGGNLDGIKNSGGLDSFIIKFNSFGIKQWTVLYGGSANDTGDAISIDSSNNVYMLGNSTGGILGTIKKGGHETIFVAKFNNTGTRQWTWMPENGTNEKGNGIKIDSLNNVYVTGTTMGEFDGNISKGGLDVILVKLNSKGNKEWSIQFGSSFLDQAFGLEIDTSNNIFITGSSDKKLDGNKHYGSYDVFLSKFDTFGTKQWIKQYGASSSEVGKAICIDLDGNIIIAGDAESDIFITKFNNQGLKLW